MNLESNTSISSLGINIYENEKVESMVGYINKDIAICAIWSKIKKDGAKIEVA